MVSPVQQIESLYKRLEKAREIATQGKVHPIIGKEGHFVVQSSTGGFYLVNDTCGCPDATNRADTHKGWCKHKLAVEIYKEQPKEEPKPKARRSRAKGDEAAAEAEMQQRGHYVPGDPAPGDDGRSNDEKIADLFPSDKEKSAPTQPVS